MESIPIDATFASYISWKCTNRTHTGSRIRSLWWTDSSYHLQILSNSFNSFESSAAVPVVREVTGRSIFTVIWCLMDHQLELLSAAAIDSSPFIFNIYLYFKSYAAPFCLRYVHSRVCSFSSWNDKRKFTTHTSRARNRFQRALLHRFTLFI